MRIREAGILLVLLCLLANCLQAQIKTTKKKGHRSLTTAMAEGKKVYMSICLACHMADGNGVQNMNPPLIKTTYVLGDKKTLIKIVLNGFNEDVAINGKTYSNNMSPHSDLKDRQIADVLTYVRKCFGNQASTITAAEVKKVRAENVK